MERREVRIVFILAALVLALSATGWLGLMIFGGMPAGAAISETLNILSTCGFGDYPVKSTAGYIIVAVLQIGALVIVAAAIAVISQTLLAGTIKQYLGRFRMDERIQNLRNHFIITGYSLTGEALIADLQAEGQDYVVIERNADVITRLEERGLLFVEGDATDEAVLKKAGIERARAVFAVLSADSDNLMAVLSARGLNEKATIVTKSTREDYIARFKRAGASVAISPQEWASRRMIQAVLRPNLLTLLSSLLDPTVSDACLDEVPVPKGSPMAGKSLAESQIRRESEIVILGIMHSNNRLEASPGPDSVIHEGDVLIGYGKQDNFARMAAILKG